jgi:hypothetical protein
MHISYSGVTFNQNMEIFELGTNRVIFSSIERFDAI